MKDEMIHILLSGQAKSMAINNDNSLTLSMMTKLNNYGFRTPVRRSVSNVTGHKVGGELSGSECKIKRYHQINIDNSLHLNYSLSLKDSTPLFLKKSGVAAVGGYFHSNKNLRITFSIEIDGDERIVEKYIEAGRWEKFGLCRTIKAEASSQIINVSAKFETEDPALISYTHFNYGFIDYKYFIENDVALRFFGPKKEIAFPEQFYFYNEIIIKDSFEGLPFIIKSCNRCQRFLPINIQNERTQLAFSNHCATNSPCKHKSFANYQILENCLNEKELEAFIAETPYELKGNFIVSHYGHQLECKACKKFFVNSALNHLRTATQHREDGLRRRAIEMLTRKLLGLTSIYHSFRQATGIEFDKYIWDKFGRRCFKCTNPIEKLNEMHLDHTMPLAYLYPLDETATCLCSTCNGSKSDIFPINFYSNEQLESLIEITGLDKELLLSKKTNQKAVEKLKEEIIWLFEEFLTSPEYQKVSDGKRAADSIFHSLQKVVNNSETPFDLNEEYKRQKVNITIA